MTVICPKSRFFSLKHTALEEEEAEDLKGAELNPRFP